MMKPKKVPKLDVVIRHNVSDVVTGEYVTESRSFIFISMSYQFKSILMVSDLEYFPIKWSEDRITSFIDRYHKTLDNIIYLKGRSNTYIDN